MCKCPNYLQFDGSVYDGYVTKKVRILEKGEKDDLIPLPSDFKTEIHYTNCGGTTRLRFIGHLPYDKAKFTYENIPSRSLIQVPCGKCLECRLEQTRVWANRCVLEAKQWEHNYFVTLTYNDDMMPTNDEGVPTIRYEDVQKFLRKLRYYLGKEIKLRYLVGCEYGSKSNTPPIGRPHYHFILFNCPLRDLSQDFREAIDVQYDKDGNATSCKFKHHQKPNGHIGLSYSKLIHKAWDYKGNISVGEFSFDCAAYISQYCTKKINPKNEEAYKYWNVFKEVVHCSTRPGIGAGYFDTHPYDQVYANDHIIVAGKGSAHIASIPRYFDKLTIKKFGSAKFLQNVKPRRLVRSDKNLVTYFHSGVNYDHLHQMLNYRLEKRQKLKTQI